VAAGAKMLKKWSGAFVLVGGGRYTNAQKMVRVFCRVTADHFSIIFASFFVGAKML
jgi:hypothetical protein